MLEYIDFVSSLRKADVFPFLLPNVFCDKVLFYHFVMVYTMNILLVLQLLMVRVATISIFFSFLKFQFLHGFFKDLHPDDQVLCSFGQLNKEITSAVFGTKVSNNLKVILFFWNLYTI